MKNSVLIVDDEENILRSLKTYLELCGYIVFTASTTSEAEQLFDLQQPEVALIDVFLQGDNGLDLMKKILERNLQTIIIVISGHGDVKTAIEAIKAGAYDFLEKPLDTEKLRIIIDNGLRQRGLLKQIESFRQKWLSDNMVVGVSREMQSVVNLAEKAGPSNLSVLIHGESGTGKELVAYYIYLNSGKMDSPYVVVNCAAIQPELFESSLFGHKKGAFTGAISDKKGFFLSADGGTLFLDEIGEIPLFLQAKLLRAIEYGEIQGVGYDTPVPVRVRIIAATNRNLQAEIGEGKFREDLFFRLAQVPVGLPSLRERREDIPLLIERFASELETKKIRKSFDKEALEYLKQREYKGNIRELRNLVARVCLLSDGDIISRRDIEKTDAGYAGRLTDRAGSLFEETMSFQEAKRVLEKRYIETQLKKFHYSIKSASEALGLLPNNLSRKISELGITIHKE